ncbi:protease complex subunit PrcB family protein [Geobacter hydrogenophilus]|uniref:PrcB C-terminal domain-containing protein n=1 Tax=Geobacter hydrogenophilus TaxID=40983 RepID=A0A9W6LF18_9BACT|nr:protease complex subunit PrcB family protein [Geobacter hydrogenophilus]MBT0892698.1 protease complex subunit PrcB family protein [Geobacter hydrogenophilus]GLI40096.1 hypothetical protein GHYDROH2_35970 [Geobacter hydrogenophilus]
MNSIRTPLLLVFAIVSLVGCATAIPVQPPPAAFKVSVETVAKGVGGAYSEPGTDTQLVWPLIRVIAGQGEFSSFWNLLHRNVTPVPALPAVDFSRNEVVAVVDMVRPTGGYSIEVKEVQEGMDGIWLTIIRRKPGEGCFTAQSLTQPYHLVAIRKSGKRCIPNYVDVTYSCP